MLKKKDSQAAWYKRKKARKQSLCSEGSNKLSCSPSPSYSSESPAPLLSDSREDSIDLTTKSDKSDSEADEDEHPLVKSLPSPNQ